MIPETIYFIIVCVSPISIENTAGVVVTDWNIDSIAARVREDFGSSLMNWQLVSRGQNTVFSGLLAGSVVFAKIYGPLGRQRSEIDFSHAFLDNFNDESGLVGVSKPFQNMAGNSVSEIMLDGRRHFYALFPVAEGAPPAPNAADSAIVGRGAALLHLALAPQHSDPVKAFNPERLLRNYGEIITRSTHLSNNFKFLISRASRKAAERLLGKYNPCMTVPMHGDLNNLNCRIQNGRVNFFDFEDCGFGGAAYDLSKWISSVEPNDGILGERGELIASFLKGYQSVTPLATAELCLLPELTFLSSIESLIWVLVNDLIPDHYWPTVESVSASSANIYIGGDLEKIIRGIV